MISPTTSSITQSVRRVIYNALSWPFVNGVRGVGNRDILVLATVYYLRLKSSLRRNERLVYYEHTFKRMYNHEQSTVNMLLSECTRMNILLLIKESEFQPVMKNVKEDEESHI